MKSALIFLNVPIYLRTASLGGARQFTAARVEAEEEAGVTGKPRKKPIGSFPYWKRRAEYFDLANVTVYPFDATKTLAKWKEQGERQVQWVAPGDASIVVEELGLATLLGKLRPKKQRKASKKKAPPPSSS